MTSPGGVEAAQTRAWQEDDSVWLDRSVWARAEDGRWWAANDFAGTLYSRTDEQMTAAGAVLVATADGPTLPGGAIRPQVLTEDTPEPARPWRVVDPANPQDDWNSGEDPWDAIVGGLFDGTAVYVIGGDRG